MKRNAHDFDDTLHDRANPFFSHYDKIMTNTTLTLMITYFASFYAIAFECIREYADVQFVDSLIFSDS